MRFPKCLIVNWLNRSCRKPFETASFTILIPLLSPVRNPCAKKASMNKPRCKTAGRFPVGELLIGVFDVVLLAVGFRIGAFGNSYR